MIISHSKMYSDKIVGLINVKGECPPALKLTNLSGLTNLILCLSVTNLSGFDHWIILYYSNISCLY